MSRESALQQVKTAVDQLAEAIEGHADHLTATDVDTLVRNSKIQSVMEAMDLRDRANREEAAAVQGSQAVPDPSQTIPEAQPTPSGLVGGGQAIERETQNAAIVGDQVTETPAAPQDPPPAE